MCVVLWWNLVQSHRTQNGRYGSGAGGFWGVKSDIFTSRGAWVNGDSKQTDNHSIITSSRDHSGRDANVICETG